jgi:hypothetical protein
MKRIIGFFRIRPEERWPGAIALLAILALNTLFVCKMAGTLLPVYRGKELTSNLLDHFHVSGFDPITLITISSWMHGYNVFRHPLLALFMYPFYLLNSACEALFGVNCALFIAAAMMAACAFYSFIFIRRIFRDVLCLPPTDANLLSALFFSFGYVMLITFVSDHFGFSMALLLFALCIAGRRMREGRLLPTWQTALLLIVATGITTTNSVKMVLAQLFVNRRRFFSPRNLLLGIALPAAALWMFCQYEYRTFIMPGEKVRYAANMKKRAAEAQKKAAKEKELQIAYAQADSAGKARIDSLRSRKPAVRTKMGRPISKKGFMLWTDVTTSRTRTLTENFFGEPIQLHRSHLLGDVLLSRPMFVAYDWTLNYVAEALLVFLFLAGIWCGRRSRFLWLALSWLACDLALHIGLGFGMNEVYIMSPHWLFIIPVAIAFAFRQASGRLLLALRLLTVALATFFLLYNGTLITGFLLAPVS